MTRRENSRQRTRQALLDAGRTLFMASGFENVTMDDVARYAGVSRPTAFRYFRTKADLVFAPQDEWRELIRTRPTDQTLDPAGRIERTALRVISAIEADPEAVLTSYRIAMASPALQQASAARDRDWVSVMANQLHPPLPASDAFLAGGAVMGMLSSAFELWAHDPASVQLTDVVKRGLPFITTGLRNATSTSD